MDVAVPHAGAVVTAMTPVSATPIPLAGARSASRVRHRRDFLAANRGARVVTDAFILLVHPTDVNADGGWRAGFTVSRKVGNAVARNRARRRLREMARLALPERAIAGADHIFIARPQTRELPFDTLVGDMHKALGKVRHKLAQRAADKPETAGGPA